jgi:hypothetical protein
VWCLREDGLLQSVLYDDVWRPARELVATCASGHRAPDEECACGIYAAREPDEALRYLVGRDEAQVVGRLLGRVALWGKVIECERGWRAERAYPLEVEVADVAAAYGVGACGAIATSASRASMDRC